MRTIVTMILLAAAAGAAAQESKLTLKEGPGRDKAMQCIACHSVDYIRMNSPFLDKKGWVAEVTKMIKVYGAPIPEQDVEIIATYLAREYGR